MVCTAIILIADYRLSYYSDIIAEIIELSRTWIGVVLLASTTSLPELITGISSVAMVGAPDIAVGDVWEAHAQYSDHCFAGSTGW